MKFLSFSLCMAMTAVVITAGCTDAEPSGLAYLEKAMEEGEDQAGGPGFGAGSLWPAI